MSTCNLLINGHSVKANIGESLIDAGLGGWVAIPHDCCSGQCESCRVTVVSGSVDDNGTVYANGEDGVLYGIKQGGAEADTIFLGEAIGAAYTPLAMDDQGRVYTQNIGRLFVIGQ